MDASALKSFLQLGSVGIIVGIIQVLKPIIPNSKWYGLLAVVFGVILNFAIIWATTVLSPLAIVTAVVYGVISGLAANGAYSSGQIQADKVVVDEKKLEKLGITTEEVK
jgi:hypothetical protein